MQTRMHASLKIGGLTAGLDALAHCRHSCHSRVAEAAADHVAASSQNSLFSFHPDTLLYVLIFIHTH